MLDKFYETISINSNVPVIIISISLMLFLGFLTTRITKLLKLPNVTAYIITGVIIGPYCFNLIPSYVITGCDFITDISLAFIAFGVGEYLKISSLKENGLKNLIITLTETILTFITVYLLTKFILKLDNSFSILLSVLASSTAPASTLMTIRQTKSKGEFVDTLLQVIALDNVISLIAFSIAISFVLSTINNNNNIMFMPLLYNLIAIILSIIFGYILKILMNEKRTTDNRLIISIATLLAFCGICAAMDISPLLGCMVMGMVYINITNDEKLFKQLNYFSPPILLLFFVLSGIKFNIASLFETTGTQNLFTIGILYFIFRIIGKYIGAYLGCKITKKNIKIKNYLGLGLIPQAGVSIGLASLATRTLQNDIGNNIQTIILASGILYEIIGPICAKMSLSLTESFTSNIDDIEVIETKEDGTKKNNVEILIERINKIQKNIKNDENIEEEAYNEAINKYEENMMHHFNRMRRR